MGEFDEILDNRLKADPQPSDFAAEQVARLQKLKQATEIFSGKITEHIQSTRLSFECVEHRTTDYAVKVLHIPTQQLLGYAWLEEKDWGHDWANCAVTLETVFFFKVGELGWWDALDPPHKARDHNETIDAFLPWLFNELLELVFATESHGPE